MKPAPKQLDKSTIDRKTYPTECRERLVSYRGRLILRMCYSVNDGPEKLETIDAGLIPVMVMSNRCNLEGMAPDQLVAHHEESEELGGYFIINGLEKIIRLLIVQRRNHPLAIVRPSFANRGKSYTQFGVQIRSVRPDQTSQSIVLHYLADGNVTLRFSWRKNEYLVPVVMILKALIETNDRAIFDGIVGDDTSNSFLTDRLELLLRSYKSFGLRSQKDALAYLGDKFRVVFRIPKDMSDVDAGKHVLDKIILVHLQNDNDAKFRMILFMIRKLYSLVSGECCPDNPDAAQHQEILVGGFLYGMIVKEKIEEYLNSIQDQVRSDLNTRQGVDFNEPKYMRRLFTRVNNNIGQKLQYFLSTGNLVSSSGLDLQQVSGYTVIAEKLNYHRFISHFRMVHRGSFFAQLKTTTVRKLLPESWGFLCPVHTPDGSPCGLLNHLAHKCKIITEQVDSSSIPQVLTDLGVLPPTALVSGPKACVVQLDGKILGWTTHEKGRKIADIIRYWKINKPELKIPKTLEIGYVPPSRGGQYPGLFLFTQQSRMTRPVKYLPTSNEDWVGPFEQVYMNIAITPDEIERNIHTHVEFSPTNILSILANMTPFSDFNQSPRNMYQCQMGKQTMGTPGTALVHRSDNKLYQLQGGQSPIVRANLFDEYGLDNYPNGTNAVVAVISYTGYDMDDAMIINKSVHERGFAHGSIYKVEHINLDEKRRRGDPITMHFGFGPDDWPAEFKRILDDDGLPMIGSMVTEGDPLCAYYDETLGKTKFSIYKSSEVAYVEDVKLLGDENDSEFQRFTVKLRVPRSPLIGDKFSSRHGQKGVCSQKWPAINMPFTETGMQPDIIINPHAFPSRMTIGMFVESLAGKAGALHGTAQDSTPWMFNEENRAADYFGEQLIKSGYNYYGNEPMYSGVTGEELRVDIYIGLVFYQRLRHMVNDKFQVRSTGPVNSLTMQPVKGRKRHGGIRVGEMERDALIGHGAAYLLQDRLLNCSDYTQTFLCTECGSLLTPQRSVPRVGGSPVVRCRRCATDASRGQSNDDLSREVWEDGTGKRFKGGDKISAVAIPFVLKYLDSELSAMGIQMRFDVSPKP